MRGPAELQPLPRRIDALDNPSPPLHNRALASDRLRPVRGSISSGNSRSVSTNSPARSPQAATMTTSTSALRLVICCSAVFPAPPELGGQELAGELEHPSRQCHGSS
jgi:hypothetical protein